MSENSRIRWTNPSASPGADFLGASCLVGTPLWIGTATAMTPGSVLTIAKEEMIRLLHAEHELSDLFISYVVTRNLRTEEDLIDQLFSSTEKRLARTLLLLPAMASLPRNCNFLRSLRTRWPRWWERHAHE